MRWKTALLGFCLVSVCAVAVGLAVEQHPFSVHDMLAMDRISGPQLSADGQRIVFVLRKTDLEADRGRTDLWLVGADGSELRQLTSHEESDSNPRFSADGKSVWFLSTRSGTSQVWKIAIDGGEAVQVTDEPLDVGNLVVAGDGGHIAFTMEVFPECKSPQCTRDRLDKKEKEKASGRIYDSVFVRHWDTWWDGRRSHLFVMAVEGGEAVDVMAGMDADTPSKPFGGPEEITFTPNSRGVVFTACDAGKKEAWSTNFDLYVCGFKGMRNPRNITAVNEAWDTMPVFRPDGKGLASLAMARSGYESDRFRIVLRYSEENPNERQILTENWNRSPGSIVFSPDSKTIYTTAKNLGQQSLFAIDVETGQVKTLVKDGSISVFAATAERVFYSMKNLKSPAELYSVKTDGSDVQALTRINAEKIAAAKMGDYEQFTFAGWNDETVYGYLVKPVDFDPGKKYPVAFLIHGGPQGSFGNGFHYRWNPQAYAGAGYAAIMVDFHGSTGYGQEFCDSIRGDWGGKPLEDLQKGLAAALERYPWLDGERVGALGGSFGGYMINWIAGNWPGRFKCLVNHDGNLDERMAYFDTEELWFPEWDHQGTPWDNPQGYEKHNPVNFVKNWQTPMLVIHSANDFRVVDTQGLATFNALQRRGIPSRLLYFPDENHWVLKPNNSILWHKTVIGWLNQWVKN
ncbi:MAG: S9 family peptidase [Sedimentisphaerales bacterium]|nr:S9 family peptidase [Sedimentisphaerales bacterium]